MSPYPDADFFPHTRNSSLTKILFRRTFLVTNVGYNLYIKLFVVVVVAVVVVVLLLQGVVTVFIVMVVVVLIIIFMYRCRCLKKKNCTRPSILSRKD